MPENEETSEKNIVIGGIGFSKEEVEIMRLLSEGKRAKEIAAAIGKSTSYVNKRISDKEYSSSLLKRVGVQTSKELIVWYVENTRPERIKPVLVYEELPWYRSDTTLPIGLTGFYAGVTLLFLNFRIEKSTTSYLLAAISSILIPLIVNIFREIRGWWYPLKTETLVVYMRLLGQHFNAVFMSSAVAPVCGIVIFFVCNDAAGYPPSHPISMNSWIKPISDISCNIPREAVLIGVYALYVITCVFFGGVFHRIYDLHAFVGLHVPHFSPKNTIATPFFVVAIGACLLFIARGWSIALEGDTALLILQLLCILAGSFRVGSAVRHFEYVIRLRWSDWPTHKEDRQLVWATLMLVGGFLVFFVASVGFIVTTSPGAQGAYVYHRGGLVDFLYVTASFIIGLGMLLVPMRIEQELVDWEEGGDEDDSGETAAIA